MLDVSLNFLGLFTRLHFNVWALLLVVLAVFMIVKFHLLKPIIFIFCALIAYNVVLIMVHGI